MFYRLKRILAFPINFIQAWLAPVRYAKRIGVNFKGNVTIYGSSYRMFSTEPYLVTLHDNVFISVGATFICHDGAVLPFRVQTPSLDVAAPIIVKENCFIGAGACILKGVTIGKNCVVGAHAVVSRDVPDNSIVAGNPAVFIKTSDDYLESAKRRSLKIGHLDADEKEKHYKRIFDIS